MPNSLISSSEHFHSFRIVKIVHIFSYRTCYGITDRKYSDMSFCYFFMYQRETRKPNDFSYLITNFFLYTVNHFFFFKSFLSDAKLLFHEFRNSVAICTRFSLIIDIDDFFNHFFLSQFDFCPIYILIISHSRHLVFYISICEISIHRFSKGRSCHIQKIKF